MAEGDTKDVKIKISTEGGDQAKSTFASLIESMGGLGGAAIVANQGLELLEKGFHALEKPIEIVNELANEAVNLYKQMRSLSAVTGQTIQEAEAMQNAFALAGLSTEKLGFAMFRLSMNVEQGGKELVHMGVELETSSGHARTTGEIFEETRNKISGMATASERAAEAAKIFGARQARELMPVLSMSAEKYEELKHKAEENEAMTVSLERAMGPLIESQADLAQKTDKVRMRLAEMIAVPIVQFFTDWVAIPVVSWMDGLIARMKGLNEIALAGAQGQGGLKGFIMALATMAGTGKEAAAELGRNLEQIEKARAQVEKFAAEGHEGKKRASAEEIKMAEERSKANYAFDQAEIRSQASIDEQLSRMRTDSDTSALQEKISANARLIALANEHYEEMRAIEMKRLGPGGKLTDQEEMKLSSARDKEIQKLTLDNRKIMEVDMAKARVADAKKTADEEVKIAKDAAGQMSAVMESARKREAAIIETSLAPASQKIIATYFAERDAARESAEIKIDAINREMDAKRALAASAPQDLHMQRQVNDELRALSRQRVEAELAANDKILDARKTLVQQLRAEADKQAQTGASLEEKALANLEKRGKKFASMQDVQQEVYSMQQKASSTAANYGFGGRVNIGQLREARQLAPLSGQLRDEGVTGSQAIGMNQSKSQADLSGQQWSAIPAQLQGQVRAYMERLMTVEKGVGTTLERMTGAIEAMYAAFSSKLVRELEFQAARQ